MNDPIVRELARQIKTESRARMTQSLIQLQIYAIGYLNNAISNPNRNLGAHRYALNKLSALPDYPNDPFFHKNTLLQVYPIMICNGHPDFPPTDLLELKLQTIEFMHPELYKSN